MVKIVRSSPHQAAEESENICDPEKISRLLKQLAKHYCPLMVQILGHKTRYTSCIVSADKQYVLLDELMPSTGHDILTLERNIHVIGKLDGVDIEFTTTLLRFDKQDNILTYYMKLPEQLKYQQRRQSYRVRIPMSRQLRVLIDNGNDTMIAGELHDLSHGAAGKILPDGKTEINSGENYECVIELPCREWLYCSVEICYTKKVGSKNNQFIGARFIDLSRVQKRLIARCISELELEEVRKRAMM